MNVMSSSFTLESSIVFQIVLSSHVSIITLESFTLLKYHYHLESAALLKNFTLDRAAGFLDNVF